MKRCIVRRRVCISHLIFLSLPAMKLRLSALLFRAHITLCTMITICSGSHVYAEDISLDVLSDEGYSNGSVTYSSHQNNAQILEDYEAITFSNCYGSSNLSASSAYGGAVYNTESTVMLNNNGAIEFCDNRAGYIYSSGYRNNEYLYSLGGAIYNSGAFQINGNENIRFENNKTYYTTTSNTYCYGGVVYNAGVFSLKNNGDVTFQGNASSQGGGAIYSSVEFSISGNKNVVFLQNWEGSNGRLRSIYHAGGTMTLDASEGYSITFYDSIASWATLKLNETGKGDIVFSGATTEDDLRLMKGSAGTASEIQNSRTSELYGYPSLGGGCLIVEDEAILKVNALSVAEGASVVVKDGTLVLKNGNATISTADGAEKAVMVGASLGESSLAGTDAEHRGSVDGAHIDLAEGAEFSLQHLVLGATTRITDAPATLQLDDVTAELVMGVNASLTGSDMLMAGTMLTAGGRTLTLEENTGVVMLESTLFDSVTLRGDTLVLELAGMTLEMLNGAEYIAVSFTSGGAYASYDSSLAVTLTADGLHFTEGYTLSSDGGTSTMRYFHAEKAGVTPEPATAALSMLALAGLAARRRRKG